MYIDIAVSMTDDILAISMAVGVAIGIDIGNIVCINIFSANMFVFLCLQSGLQHWHQQQTHKDHWGKQH